MAKVYAGLSVDSNFGGEFPWTSRFIVHPNGVRQAYLDEGPPNAPATFLMLHGNPTWGFLYRRFIAELSKTYRVVVPDHVGFGRSDKPRDPKYYSLERHVANLERLAAEAKLERVVPMMHDWGGPIGMGYATRHPDRIAGLVVLNTWAFVRDPPMELPWFFRFLVLGKGGWRRATKRNIFTELFLAKGGKRKLDPKELEAYRAPHPTPEDRVGVARFPQMIPQTRDRSHPDWNTMGAIEDALPSIAAKPALLIWSLGDLAFRKPHLERWKGALRDLDGPHKLKGARHYLQEDAPERILPLVSDWAARRFR